MMINGRELAHTYVHMQNSQSCVGHRMCVCVKLLFLPLCLQNRRCYAIEVPNSMRKIHLQRTISIIPKQDSICLSPSSSVEKRTTRTQARRVVSHRWESCLAPSPPQKSEHLPERSAEKKGERNKRGNIYFIPTYVQRCSFIVPNQRAVMEQWTSTGFFICKPGGPTP